MNPIEFISCEANDLTMDCTWLENWYGCIAHLSVEGSICKPSDEQD